MNMTIQWQKGAPPVLAIYNETNHEKKRINLAEYDDVGRLTALMAEEGFRKRTAEETEDFLKEKQAKKKKELKEAEERRKRKLAERAERTKEREEKQKLAEDPEARRQKAKEARDRREMGEGGDPNVVRMIDKEPLKKEGGVDLPKPTPQGDEL